MKFIEVKTVRDRDLNKIETETINPLDVIRISEVSAEACWVTMRDSYPMKVAESRESLTKRLNEAVRDD